MALVLLLGAGAWWWLGSDQSLAFALARTARYLPAGQTLESRDVSGSLRAGGRIGWLRWESESLAVEVRDARIGWQLAPLLRRRVQLGEVHAARAADRAPRAGREQAGRAARAAGAAGGDRAALHHRRPALGRAAGAAGDRAGGSYRYRDDHHQLEITAVDIADGHYGAQLRLQGPAPMALDATLNGRVRALLAQDRSLDVRAEATIQGQLAGPDARLAVTADLHPVDASADQPMQRRSCRPTLAPWQPQPVIDAKAALQNIDLATLWPEAPATLLSGEIEAGPDATAAPGESLWQASAQVRNALPGPWDEAKLPVEQLDARARFDGSTWTLPQLSVRAGGGRIDAEGSWGPAPAPWQVDATVRGVSPGALHTRLDGAPVNGRLQAGQTGDALQFDVALQAEGGAGGTGELQGLRLERALAKGQWQDQVLDLRSLRVEARGASIEGRLQLRVDDQAASGRLNLAVPGAAALVDGRIAPNTGGGDVQARIDDAAALQGWIEGLPELGPPLRRHCAAGQRPAGRQLEGRLASGPAPAAGRQRTGASRHRRTHAAGHAGHSQARGEAAALRGGGAEPDRAQRRACRTGRQPRPGHAGPEGRSRDGQPQDHARHRASAGIERRDQWSAALASLRVQALDSARPDVAPWVLELGSPVSLKVRTASGANPRLDLEASAAAATLKGPAPGTVRIDWQPLRFSRTGTEARRAFRLQSKGRLQGLPMAWAELLGNGETLAQVGFSGDLLFNGDWDIDAGDTLRAKARLTRESGDLRVQAGEAALVTRVRSHGTGTASERTMDAAGPGASTPAGLKRAEFVLDAEGDTVRANLAWDSERAGEIRVEASTRVQQRQGGWHWADDAPLAGRVTARMPNLGVWSMLAPPGWRMAGTLDADATLAGNRSEPRWNGTLAADKLAPRALVEGLDLRDGRLRATLAGNRVEITEFTLKGGAGAQTRIPGQSGNLSTAASEAARDGGTLSARGELGWGAAPVAGAGSGIRMSIQADLRALRVLVRADRQLTLSGNLQARLESGQFTVRGDIKTDRAVIILPDETAPSLGSDVVVRSAAIDREAAEEAKRRAAENQSEVARARDRQATGHRGELRPRRRLRGPGPRHHDPAGRQAGHPQHRPERTAAHHRRGPDRRRPVPRLRAGAQHRDRDRALQRPVRQPAARHPGDPSQHLAARRRRHHRHRAVAARAAVFGAAVVGPGNPQLAGAGPGVGHQRRRIGAAAAGRAGAAGRPWRQWRRWAGKPLRARRDRLQGSGQRRRRPRLDGHRRQAHRAGLLRHLRARPGRHAGHAVHLLRPDPAADLAGTGGQQAPST